MEEYRTLPIEDDVVIMEARNGRTIDGNIFYMARELMTDDSYSHLKVNIVAFDREAEVLIRKKIQGFQRGRIDIVLLESPEYYRLMATARYIVNDSAIRNFYVKKEGQIYLNVWHGTPLKTMGKRVWHEPHSVGSVQKNFIVADYLLYPSDYMMEHMIEDYMISDISRAKILMGGYPRNTVFFDAEGRRMLRDELSLTHKKVYAYMPTYRPDVMKDPTESILRQMDDALEDDEVLYVNLHPLTMENVAFSEFRSVHPFPDEFEVYTYLNCCDALITDYSSVFYDFALTGRKIVLFSYDEEDYFRTRGLYEPLSSLPFANVKTVGEVFDVLRDGTVPDYSGFIKKYGHYEGPSSAADLCRFFFLEEHSTAGEGAPHGEGALPGSLRILDMPCNGLPNVIVHNGELDSEERRMALLDAIKELDPSKANYYLFFNRRNVKDCWQFLHDLPHGIRFFGRTGVTVFSREQEDAGKGYEDGRISFDEYWDIVRPAYAIEKRRYLGDAPVSDIIQLPSYHEPGPDSTEMELEMAAYL